MAAMHQDTFGGRAPPDPLGELMCSPRTPPSHSEGGLLILRGKGRDERGKGEGWETQVSDLGGA